MESPKPYSGLDLRDDPQLKAFISSFADLKLEVALAKEIYMRLQSEIEQRNQSIKEAQEAELKNKEEI